jgi:oxygen-independent coproporphyrinogen-3 oxidase
MTTPLALYLHIPFCRAKCPYCDFYSLPCSCPTAQRRAEAAYTASCIALLREKSRIYSTAYIGGGTPSVLPPELLGQILTEVCVAGEFTIECNPSSVTTEFCETIVRHGVNRVSLGLQSVVPQERRALGRVGDIHDVTQALRQIGAAGINNISLDVMLGVPHQTQESLMETLRFCAESGARHISAYLLKIEEGTWFHTHAPAGLPDDDAQAELYLFCCAWLETHGFAQYEISNFAQPGYESQHNLNYWHCGEYEAIGPGAHGFTQGRRWHYAPDLATFLRRATPIDDGPGGDFDEHAMLALRLCDGFAHPTAQMRIRAAAMPGLVVCDTAGLRLTREGFLLSNQVIGQLLG